MLTEASEAARSGALVVDHHHRGTLTVEGPDRTSWLNAIVTCDIGRLRPGDGSWGLALTKQGKIQSDIFVVAGPDRLFVAVQSGRGPELAEFLDRMLIMEDAELADVSGSHAWLALHGPEAVSVARETASSLGGVAASIDWTGLGGAALVLPVHQAEAARDAFRTRGGVVQATPNDWLELRLERGLPEMGVDYTVDDNPHQAALERRAVAWDKGCYLGQEVVCMVDMRGKVRRRSAAVLLDEAVAPNRDEAVTAPGRDQPVGLVTSSVVSHRLGRGIVLARLLTNLSEAGARVLVGGVGGVVAPLPEDY